GSHREYKALERPVVHAVPNAAGGVRLIHVYLLSEGYVKAVKVDEFARRVDLRLVDILGLAEHGGRIQSPSPVARQEIRRLEEDGCPDMPRRSGPFLPDFEGRCDRGVHFLGAA